MKIHFTASIIFTLAATLTHAASFDCNKASNFTEKAICNDQILSKLDDILSENYKYMSSSNKVGVRERKDIKKTQNSWLATRNKCTDNECLVNSYRERIDEICDYPVLPGAASICKSAEELETESGAEPRRLSKQNTPADVDAIKVIVQICLPNKIVAFEDVEVDLKKMPKAKTLADPGTEDSQGDRDVVRRWIVGSTPGELRRYWIPFSDVSNTNGILRAGGEFVDLFGSTKKNQPVYEVKGRRQKDYVALKTSVEVERDGQREFSKYWFKLPASIPTGEFTNWQEPISQEDQQVRDKQLNPTVWNLTHGKEMDIFPVGQNAPKMRFKLMKVGDYYDENRFWYRSQKALAEKYYRGVVGEAREKIHFVPKSGSAIPGC